VRELGLRLTSAELTEWLAYDLVEPFGQSRADDAARGLMCLTATAAGAKNVTPDDFLKTWKPAQAPDLAAQLAVLVGRLDALAQQEGG
jgi:hypothetical protein